MRGSYLLTPLLLLAFLCGWSVQSAPFRLSLAGLDASHRPTLLLTDLDSGRYAIEASTNLLRWFSLTNGQATGGQLRYLHAEAPAHGTLYYRGVRLDGTGTPLAKITPMVDSNHIALGVVSYEDGGRLALTNSDGTRYIFSVAPKNVVQPVAITMQLVTNFVSFPFENELRAAVRFEPAGFRFHGAGLLEIQFPGDVPHLKLSSFAFDGSGVDFHLTPDRVAPGAVRIPVTHLSVFGTAVWGPTERTRAFETRVSNVESAGRHRAAEILGRERQLQLLGAGDGSDAAFAEVNQITQDYYDRHLKPEIAASEGDCSLARALVPRVLGIERQQELLGYPQSGSFVATSTWQKIQCNCLQELIFACEEASISSESFMRGLLGMERQAQLLGGTLDDCGFGTISEWFADAQEGRLPCMTKWVGTISYKEGASFSGQSSSSSAEGSPPQSVVTTVLESMTIDYRFTGGVERVELEDDSIPGFFSALTWDLYFYPDASGAYSYTSDTRKSFVCRRDGGVKQEDQIHRVGGAGDGSNEVKVHIAFEDDVLTAFTIVQRKGLSLKMPNRLTRTRTDCPRPNPDTGHLEEQRPKTVLDATGEFVRTFKADYVPTERVVFSKSTPDELDGTVTGVRKEVFGTGMVDIPYEWKFSLRRRKD